MRKTNNEAKLAVAQVYWNNDQEYKQAEARRSRSRDLALVAIGKGETVGPVQDADGMAHWLTHGEKERVEMSPEALLECRLQVADFLSVVDVNSSRLKELLPRAYAHMLKHKSTRRTKHSCLTWSEVKKAPKARRRAVRS